ncbi:rna binding protein [Nannochloropsis oceanica]
MSETEAVPDTPVEETPNAEEPLNDEGKLYVGNLAFKTTEDGLREAFGSHGEITFARVISDRDSGRSRGFGFVTFAEKDEAQLAIDALNETELDGRTIRVNFAQPRDPNAPRPPRRSYRGRGRGRGFRGGRARGENGGEGAAAAPES